MSAARLAVDCLPGASALLGASASLRPFLRTHGLPIGPFGSVRFWSTPARRSSRARRNTLWLRGTELMSLAGSYITPGRRLPTYEMLFTASPIGTEPARWMLTTVVQSEPPSLALTGVAAVFAFETRLV